MYDRLLDSDFLSKDIVIPNRPRKKDRNDVDELGIHGLSSGFVGMAHDYINNRIVKVTVRQLIFQRSQFVRHQL